LDHGSEGHPVPGNIANGHGRAGHDAIDQLRLLIESATDHAILTLDTSGHVASWNVGAERIKGYRAEEILGRHFSCFYTPEDVARGRPQRALQVAAREGRFEDEGWRVRKDGSHFWANVVITALQDEHGQLRGFGKVTRDFTSRKQVEERRELLHLREAVRTRDEFLSVASHELKTPLTPLQLKLTGLLRIVEAHPDALLPVSSLARDLEVARRQVHKLTTLIDALLDVSHLEMGRLQLDRAPMELSALVREVVAHHTSQAAQAGCDVEVEAATLIEGTWDKKRLEQVLTNLLTNALKYGAGKPIHVRVSAEGEEALLIVRDEGIGIAPEHQPHIFDRFMRAVSERNYGGLGLGLFIVHQVVEAHGGSVSVQSIPGEGATFTVRLPRQAPSRGG
jgi:PAS domain S-box-containing protein